VLKINPDFENLIPPLSEDEFNGLEKSILEEGVREPIVVWTKHEFANPDWELEPDPALTSETFIVDGHNRYKIATKYGLDFDTVEYDFEDEDAVKVWMIDTQLGRRNLPDIDRILLEQERASITREKANANQGTRTDLQPSVQMDKRFKAVDTRAEIAEKANVSLGSVARVEQIQKHAPELISEIRLGKQTIGGAYKQIVESKKKAERKAAIEKAKAQPRSASYVDIFTTDKKYRVIYADPPWSYNDECKTGGVQSRGASGVYTVMTLEDICKLPVPSQDNAVLFMWTTSPMLEVSFDVINSWGFTYKSSFIWDKVAHNRGHYNSVRHEFLLIAVKGSCTPDVKKLYDSVVSIERTEHSRKPAYFRELIDELYPIGERIELFAREAADGWDVWGDMA